MIASLLYKVRYRTIETKETLMSNTNHFFCFNSTVSYA